MDTNSTHWNTTHENKWWNYTAVFRIGHAIYIYPFEFYINQSIFIMGNQCGISNAKIVHKYCSLDHNVYIHIWHADLSKQNHCIRGKCEWKTKQAADEWNWMEKEKEREYNLFAVYIITLSLGAEIVRARPHL